MHLTFLLDKHGKTKLQMFSDEKKCSSKVKKKYSLQRKNLVVAEKDKILQSEKLF